LFIELNHLKNGESFSLMTAFPKRVFTDEDYQATLRSLGLSPSAAVTVTRMKE